MLVKKDDFLLENEASFIPRSTVYLYLFFPLPFEVWSTHSKTSSKICASRRTLSLNILFRFFTRYLFPFRKPWPQSPPRLQTTNAKLLSVPAEISTDMNAGDISSLLLWFSKAPPQLSRGASFYLSACYLLSSLARNSQLEDV